MVSLLDGLTVECHDDLAGFDLVAFSDLVVEAFAVHCDCVDTDVDQDFHACIVCKTDRVLGISNGCDLAVERSKYNALSGVDSYAFAEYAGSECVIRDISLCYNSTNCGSNNLACVAADDRICGSCYLGNRSCCCLLGLILFPDHACQEECKAAGDRKDDGVKQSVVDGQVSGDTGNTVSSCADAHECCYESTKHHRSCRR